MSKNRLAKSYNKLLVTLTFNEDISINIRDLIYLTEQSVEAVNSCLDGDIINVTIDNIDLTKPLTIKTFEPIDFKFTICGRILTEVYYEQGYLYNSIGDPGSPSILEIIPIDFIEFHNDKCILEFKQLPYIGKLIESIDIVWQDFPDFQDDSLYALYDEDINDLPFK